MDKTFLANTLLRSPTFLAHPPAAKGHWLQLQALCSSEENGGRIEGARQWGNEQWKAAMGKGGGSAAFDALVKHRLAEIDGNDVVVAGYHLECERLYQERRQNGAKGGIASAARRGAAAAGNSDAAVPPDPKASRGEVASTGQAPLKRSSSAQGEGGEAEKGTAEKGMGRDGTGRDGTELELVPGAEIHQPESPALAELERCLRWRKLPASTEADRTAIAQHFDVLPPTEADAVIEKMRTYFHSVPRPSLADFLARQTSAGGVQ